MTELAGYTARVYEMFDVFEEVRVGVYRRSVEDQQGAENRGGSCEVKHGMRLEGSLQIRGVFCFLNWFNFVSLYSAFSLQTKHTRVSSPLPFF